MAKHQKPTLLTPKKLQRIQDDVSTAHIDNCDTLLRRARFKTNDNELSEDLVQTTFLKTLLYLQRGGKIVLMRNFLNHILGDLIVDEYRKGKPVSLDVLLEKGFDLSDRDEQARHIDVLDGQQVMWLLKKLPQKYQRIMELRYLKGLSLKEIAILTDQTENTVAVQSHRGVRKLHELYVAEIAAVSGKRLPKI